MSPTQASQYTEKRLRSEPFGAQRILAATAVLTMVLLCGIGLLFWHHRRDDLRRVEQVIEVVETRKQLDACFFESSTRYYAALASKAPSDRLAYEKKYSTCSTLVDTIELKQGNAVSLYGLELMRSARAAMYLFEQRALNAAMADRRASADSILSDSRYLTLNTRFVHGRMQMTEALPLEARLNEINSEITGIPQRMVSRIDLMVQDASRPLLTVYNDMYLRLQRDLELATGDLRRLAPDLAADSAVMHLMTARAAMAEQDAVVRNHALAGKHEAARQYYKSEPFQTARAAEVQAVVAFSRAHHAYINELATTRLRPLIVLSVLLTSIVFLVGLFWMLAWQLTRTYLRERRRYEQGLLEAKRQAEELARLKTTFLANMSHEIRTPLTGILGFSAVLEEEVADEQREFTQLISQSGHRLLAMLDSVLNLAQLDAAAAELRPESLDLADEVRRIVQFYQPNARQKQLTLTLDLSAETIPAELDPASLNMILNNLINNALKFTRTGGVQVLVDASQEMVSLAVKDTGSGISEAFLPHIFDEFRQESGGLARLHEGAGLGLAITQRLVSLMRGHIQVESTVGVGTTFTVLFPRYATSEPQAQPAVSVSV